jgi:pimeloyl-ACP methyl ester carboxylesterase
MTDRAPGGRFTAPDGTRLAYRELGTGDPLVCLPGGPMQDAGYLQDLGGLSSRHRLVLLDPRGTGASAEPADPTTYRCDRLVDDVEALRTHLGLQRMDLLGHSGGANLALLYAARHPDRVRRLLLVSGGLAAVGVAPSSTDRRAVASLRATEAWFPEASAALDSIAAGTATAADWTALAPFGYGRWDADTRDHHAACDRARNDEAATAYGSDGAFQPHETRAQLQQLDTPVLVLVGELDVNTPPRRAAELARHLPRAEVIIQPRAAHFPWLDDATAFVTSVNAFLAEAAGGGHTDPAHP